MAPNGGSYDRAAAPGLPARKAVRWLKRSLAFAGKLTARARECFRSFAAARHSLAVRLLSSALLVSVCVTLVLTPLQLYLQYRHDLSTVELRLDQIGESDLDSLAERLWALDANQLRLQLTGILRLPDMRFVEVREAGSTGNPLVITLGEKSASSGIAREYPLLYKVGGQNRRIGTLCVQATLRGIYQRLFNTALTILASQAAEIFLVSLFVFFIFHHLVTRHLFAIASFVDSYRINNPPEPLRLRRPPLRCEDELQRVVTAFNLLSDNLQDAYRSLHEVNEQLIRDVAARCQAEAVLREREARIRRIIDSNIVGIFFWDVEGPIFEANDAFLSLVGYDREDLNAGRLRWTDLTPPEWREIDVRQWVPEFGRTGRLPPFEKEYLRKDGSRVPVLIGTAGFEESTTQGVAFVLDLTERRRAELEREKLRQLQAELAHVNRVSILGELTASLSHELKQPIAAAMTNARTCVRWLMREEPHVREAREAALRIVQDANRAAGIIDHLRSFYRKDASPERELVDVNEVVREILDILRGEANRYSIATRTDLAAELPRVKADRVQLQQVFINLMINGIEAMENAGGELTIRSALGPPGYLLISVSDTGVGLPSGKADEIFSAFFTTKPQGSGMGLAISRSIVEAHGGRLWATANAGSGAAFYLTLPIQR